MNDQSQPIHKMKTKAAIRFIRAIEPHLWVPLLYFATIRPCAFADEFRLTSITSGTNGVAVEWTNATPGSAFTLEVNSSLAPGTWTNATSRYRWPIPATRWVDIVQPSAKARYYRVKGEQLPPPNRGKLLGATLSRSMTLTQ